MTKEEILVKKFHKVFPLWKRIVEIIPPGQLELIYEAMEEYKDQEMKELDLQKQ